MNHTGIVFDIQRFSLFDGPGIRTTVFLKGCPLHCAWCHNPESQSPNTQLAYHEERCVHCMQCVACCPSGTHKTINGRHCVDFGACRLTDNCVDNCPSSALKLIGKEMTVEDTLTEVEKDRQYYGNIGGITISGGEPMLQFDFCVALCKAAKQAGIHTCIETSGYATKKQFEALLPYIDLFLYDYKETDSQRHTLFTGVDNVDILENLDYLYTSNANILVRAPIIPSYNDTKEHFVGIVALSMQYPHLKGIELMPYHDLGKWKAASIGESYTVEVGSMDEAKKQAYVTTLIDMGCSPDILMR